MVQLSGRYQGRVTPPVTVASIEQYLIITGWPWPWSCCTSLSSLSVTDSIPSSPRQSEYSCLSCPVTSSIASSCCLSWGSGFKQSVKEGPIFLHYTCKNVVVFHTAWVLERNEGVPCPLCPAHFQVVTSSAVHMCDKVQHGDPPLSSHNCHFPFILVILMIHTQICRPTIVSLWIPNSICIIGPNTSPQSSVAIIW